MTVVYNKLQYGSYVYSPSVDSPATFMDGMAARARASVPPNFDGGYSAGALLGPRPVSIEGKLIASSVANLRSAWETFKAAHAPGVAQRLFIDDNRYLNAEVSRLSEKAWNGLLYRDYTVEFVCHDPFWYGASASAPVTSSQNLSAGANTVTTAGTAYTWPVITIPVSSVAGGTVTLTGANGQTITLAPNAIETLTIDCGSETIVNGGGADRSSLMTAGGFLALVSGANTITLSTSGTITLGTVAIVWQNRWY